MMPLIGYFIGIRFADFVTNVDHWIAFVLLALIGGNMIKESFEKGEEKVQPDFSVKAMFPLAVATSIDALTIGITLAFLNVNIWIAAAVIGIITFALSAAGVYIGYHFGAKLGSKAGILGGVVLICLGIKIFLEHLGVIA